MACNIRLSAIKVGRTILLNQKNNIIRYTASTNSIPNIRIANFQTSTNLHKSKRSFASEPAPDTNDDVPVIRTKGKGAKGLKGGGKRGNEEEEIKTSTSNQDLPGEKFNDQQLKETMQRYVKRCKETITRLVSNHGRADPSILDHVQVSIPNINPTPGPTKSRTEEGPSSSIHDFATIGTRDGSLIVTCFDTSTVKYVERAIHLANLGLTPQKLSTNEEDEAILRIPIPRPTMESRTKLLKDVHETCENSKTGIRNARHIAQKAIKSDEKRKVISADEGRSEMKKVEEETKKHSSEVDKLHEQMKAKIEQQ